MDARYLDLLIYRTIAEFKVEASRNYLGLIWWFLEPVLYLGVFYFVFAMGFRRGGEGFVQFLLTGLVAWKWFDSTVRGSAKSIKNSAGLIGQVYFPKVLLPLSMLLTNTAKFAIIFAALLLFLLLIGVEATASWFYLPALILVQLLLTAAISLLVAAFTPFVPDLQYVVSYGMTMLFFTSGIFYDFRRMDPSLQDWLLLNPVVTMLDSYRAVLIRAESPDWIRLAVILLGSVLVMAAVVVLYRRFDRIYPKVVS